MRFQDYSRLRSLNTASASMEIISKAGRYSTVHFKINACYRKTGTWNKTNLHLLLALPDSNNVPLTGRMPELCGHVLMEGLSSVTRSIWHFWPICLSLNNNLLDSVFLLIFYLDRTVRYFEKQELVEFDAELGKKRFVDFMLLSVDLFFETFKFLSWHVDFSCFFCFFFFILKFQ